MGFAHKPAIKRTKPADVFGHIEGVSVGSTFESRLFLHHSSVHSGILAGIYGSKAEGCYSIVMSGGYEDDKDEGYKFTYTGCGGRDQRDGEKPRDGPQTCDQSWSNPRNQSLRVSASTKKPVRVVRGFKSSSVFAPTKFYRYDGLYVVDRAYMETGKSGFAVCKFALTRLSGQPPIPKRQGLLSLDLSEWETPIHFGPNEKALSSASRKKSPPPAKPQKRKRSDTPSSQESKSASAPGPASRSSAPSQSSSSSGKSSRPRALSVQIPPPPILPTTNASSSRLAQRPQLTPAQTHPAPPDVLALLAEWRKPNVLSKPKPATGLPVSPQSSTSTVPSQSSTSTVFPQSSTSSGGARSHQLLAVDTSSRSVSSTSGEQTAEGQRMALPHAQGVSSQSAGEDGRLGAVKRVKMEVEEPELARRPLQPKDPRQNPQCAPAISGVCAEAGVACPKRELIERVSEELEV